MPGLTPTLLLMIALSSGPDTSARENAQVWETGARHVELSAEPSGAQVEVRVSPGLGTLLLFDVPPSRVEVEPRAHFRVAALEGDLLVLLPAAAFLEVGEGKVKAHFSDGAAPATATFLLRAVPPALAERQVEVHRFPRGRESYALEVRDLREQNEALRQEVARLQAAQAHPEGLLGLLVAGAMAADGVAGQVISPTQVVRPGLALVWQEVHAFRSTQRVALEVSLRNTGVRPWRAEGAALKGRAGAALKVLRVWQAAPISPGDVDRVLVEAETTSEGAKGPFTLTLWEAGARNPVTLGNITFP